MIVPTPDLMARNRSEPTFEAHESPYVPSEGPPVTGPALGTSTGSPEGKGVDPAPTVTPVPMQPMVLEQAHTGRSQCECGSAPRCPNQPLAFWRGHRRMPRFLHPCSEKRLPTGISQPGICPWPILDVTPKTGCAHILTFQHGPVPPEMGGDFLYRGVFRSSLRRQRREAGLRPQCCRCSQGQTRQAWSRRPGPGRHPLRLPDTRQSQPAVPAQQTQPSSRLVG